MTGIVDRIEEEIIVVEVDEKIYNIPKEKCIGEVHEGDVVDVEKYEEIISIKTNNEETKNREEYIDDLTKNMWE